MKDNIPGIVIRAVPAAVMGIGCVPFFQEGVPREIQAGGACLAAIAMMLVDVQNDKRLGYTNRIVRAVQKVPGLEKASEGEILGALTLAASAFLGLPALGHIAETGQTYPDIINTLYNGMAFPMGAAMGFPKSRELVEKHLGKDLVFEYRDADGIQKKTDPISTARLFQQISYLAGSVGITAYGTALEAPSIQFTGLMFMLSCGINMATISAETVSVAAKAIVLPISDYSL